MSIREKEYENYDKMYEELEASPYNAAQDYFNGGWDAVLRKFGERFSNELTGGMVSDDIVSLFWKIHDELEGEN